MSQPLKTDPVEARRLVLELGRALHEVGTPAHRIERTMGRISGMLGLETNFLSTPTSLLIAFGPPGEQDTALMRLEPGDVNLGALAELDEVLAGVTRGQETPAGALTRIRALRAADTARPGATLAAMAVSSGAAAWFFGGTAVDLGLAMAVGLATGLLAMGLGRLSSGGPLVLPVAGVLASVLAAVLAVVVPGAHTDVLVPAGLLYLLPGLTLTVGMVELATRNLVSGTARLTSGTFSLLSLTFGVAIGSRAALLLPAATPVGEALRKSWPALDLAALVVSAAAFTVLFRVRRRDAPWVALSCALAWFGARWGSEAFGSAVGAWLGALAVGAGANAYSRLLDRPAQVPLVPGILLLVPGSLGLRGTTGMLAGDTVLAVDAVFDAGLAAVALAVGLLVANVVVPPRKGL